MAAAKPISDAYLHAYVDGQLSKERYEKVDAYILANPEKAKQVQQYQLINQRLHNMFDPILEQPVPQRMQNVHMQSVANQSLPVDASVSSPDVEFASLLNEQNVVAKVYTLLKANFVLGFGKMKARLGQASNQQEVASDPFSERRFAKLPLYLAEWKRKMFVLGSGLANSIRSKSSRFVGGQPAIAQRTAQLKTLFSPANKVGQTIKGLGLLVVGVILGGFLLGTPSKVDSSDNVPTASLMQHALDAHYVYSRERRRAVELSAKNTKYLLKWLSNRLQQQVSPAKLDAGFKFIGGRLLAANRRHAAFFVYQNEQGKRLTQFISRPGRDTVARFNCIKQDQIGVCSWTWDALDYYVMGELPMNQFTVLGEQIYRQMQ